MKRKRIDPDKRNLIGPRIKEARLALGLSQEKVVELLELDHGIKMDRSALTRLENRKRSVDDFEIRALSLILGRDVGWFFVVTN